MPHIIPIKDLKDTASISRMCQESNDPVYITKNGYGDMVIMSMKAYEEKMLMLDVYTNGPGGGRYPSRPGQGRPDRAEDTARKV